MSLDTVRLFAIAKVGWIRQQQGKLNQQDRETPREFLSRESHYVWGDRFLMKVIEADAPPAIELKHSRMVFQIRPGMDSEKKKELLDGWYRELVREAIQPVDADDHLIKAADFSLTSTCPMNSLVTARSALRPQAGQIAVGGNMHHCFLPQHQYS